MNGRDKRKRARARAERLKHPLKPAIDNAARAADKLVGAIAMHLTKKAAA